MSSVTEHLASLDATLAAARAAWDAERDELRQHILQLETELAIRTRLHDEAVRERNRSLQITAKLLTQFGIVASVFEEARKVALDAGLYTNPDALTEPKTAENAKALIDKVTGGEA